MTCAHDLGTTRYDGDLYYTIPLCLLGVFGVSRYHLDMSLDGVQFWSWPSFGPRAPVWDIRSLSCCSVYGVCYVTCNNNMSRDCLASPPFFLFFMVNKNNVISPGKILIFDLSA
jgi:hypothetical protein